MYVKHSEQYESDVYQKDRKKAREGLTASQVTGVWSVTGSCLTVPLPSASRFRWAENRRSSFFSSSLRLLQYLNRALCLHHTFSLLLQYLNSTLCLYHTLSLLLHYLLK